MSEELQDITLVCSDCNDEFVYTVRDQEFVAEKQFTPYKRCQKCRYKKRQEKLRAQQG